MKNNTLVKNIQSTMDDFPPHMVCSITGDLMYQPVYIDIDGHRYVFEKVAIEAWLTTPNGSKNPLTMQPFPKEKETVFHIYTDLAEEIKKYREKHGIEEKEPEVPVIEPFNDTDQIEADSVIANRIDREINDPNYIVFNSIFGRDILDMIDGWDQINGYQNLEEDEEDNEMLELEEVEMPELENVQEILEPMAEEESLPSPPTDIIFNRFNDIITNQYNTNHNILNYIDYINPVRNIISTD